MKLWVFLLGLLTMGAAPLMACSSDDAEGGPSSTGGGGSGGATTSSTSGGTGGTGGQATASCPGAASWIRDHLADAPVLSGDFSSRQHVESPHRIEAATGTDAKYAFVLESQQPPDMPEVGFIDVTITNLVSSDAYGGGFVTADPGMTVYLSNVYIEPNWPMWESYATTNKDGIVLDGSEAFYAEDLTIVSFNADAGIDNKANVSQLVRLEIAGPGHRSIRYWRAGPHYLVDAKIDNPGTAGAGDLIWMDNCDGTTLNVYNSTFNGEATLPADKLDCGDGGTPTIQYLSVDPRTTGEMHPMFCAPDQ